jgi:hypothetical protein
MMSSDSPVSLDVLAQRRASRKLAWYVHALVYVCVNLLLATLSLSHGQHWAVYPALGWGLGLALHGVSVFVAAPGGRLYEHLVQRERETLKGRRLGPER